MATLLIDTVLRLTAAPCTRMVLWTTFRHHEQAHASLEIHNQSLAREGLTIQEEAFNARVFAMADWASRKVLSPLMLFASQVVLMNQHLPLPNTEIFYLPIL